MPKDVRSIRYVTKRRRGEIPSICVVSVNSAHSGRFGVRERSTASTPGEE